MNKLPIHKRAQLLEMLVEGGMSMRSASRIADVSIVTVAKLLVEAGEACAVHHDENVVDVRASRVQCDEIWAFCYAKDKTVKAGLKAIPEGGAGDVWTWTALDRDTKLLIAYDVGDRSGATAREFIADLRNRLANRVQLTTDGHKVYLKCVHFDTKNFSNSRSSSNLGHNRETNRCGSALIRSMKALQASKRWRMEV